MNSELTASEIFERVSKTAKADENPWILMDHFNPDDSPILREYLPYNGGNPHAEYQNLVIARLDAELVRACESLSSQTGKIHDVLGPFNIPEFEDYLNTFSNPGIAHRKFFAYCQFKLRLSYKYEFDVDYDSLPQQTLVRKINELDDRNRLKLLWSLSNYKGDRVLFTINGRSISIKQAADRLWGKLHSNGQIGWYDFDPRFIEAVCDGFDEDGTSVQKQGLANSYSSTEPNDLIVELQERPELAPVLLKHLLRMRRYEDGRIVWPKRFTKHDLVYIILRLYSDKKGSPLLYVVSNLWKHTITLFVREQKDGSIVDFSNSELTRIAGKINEVSEPKRSVASWFLTSSPGLPSLQV